MYRNLTYTPDDNPYDRTKDPLNYKQKDPISHELENINRYRMSSMNSYDLFHI